MKDNAYTVGQLAVRCGVAVKTVQYYADEGLLAPRCGGTQSGYRLFEEENVAELRLIRSLRALGFSLDAIGKIVRGAADPREMAEMQLEVIDSQLRSLARQRTIVRAALEQRGEPDVRRRLALAAAAASLGAAERDAVVERFLERSRGGEPVEPHSALRRMLAMDLPDELTDEQLEAWIALSALLEDEDFLATLRAQHAPFEATGADAKSRFGSAIIPLLADAAAALADGRDARSESVRVLARKWSAAFAEALGRRDDADFRRWLVDYSDKTNDARIARFWELVSSLKGGSGVVSPFTAAQRLLTDALRSNRE